MENLTLCLTILITGFVVVFSVLIMLILIIKIYGAIVSRALASAESRKEEKRRAELEAKLENNRARAEKADALQAQNLKSSESSDTGAQSEISREVVAVIAAAVASTYGEGKAKITGIKRSKAPNSRPAWGMAGVFENTKPF